MEYKKIKYLDGIRGLMAVNVMISHFIVVYYPQMYSIKFGENAGGSLSLFATTPLSIFVNGNIAVQYFFVLTGFLVGLSCLKSNELDGTYILKKSCNRFFRLFPICFLATLFTAITMFLGLQRHLDIVDIALNGEFLLDYCNFTQTPRKLIYNLVLKTFLASSDYVGPFWTIRYEMWGYVISMLAVLCLRKSKLRRLAYAGISAILILVGEANYVGFFVGLFVADLIQLSDDATILSRFYRKWLYTKPAIICLSILGLYFAACPIQFSTIYTFMKYIPLISPSTIRALGCGLLIFCLSQSKTVYKVFEIKPLMFFGELSFPIYAFHWPLMLTLEAGLFKAFVSKMPYDAAAICALLITFVAIIIVSYLVNLLIKKIKINANGLIDKTTL